MLIEERKEWNGKKVSQLRQLENFEIALNANKKIIKWFHDKFHRLIRVYMKLNHSCGESKIISWILKVSKF